jgi:phosphatidylglycerol:prolipoprotein diacylglycerol transferase
MVQTQNILDAVLSHRVPAVAVLPVVTLPLLGAISTYALIRTAYVLIALLLTLRLSARQGIKARTTLTAFALGVPAGILGAHVLDMLEYWGEHGGLREVLSPTGSSIYGAFVVVFPTIWFYARSQGAPPLRLFDAGAPAMALGEAMTRVGCFLNGCCYGVPWDGPWALTFPRGSFAYSDQIARGLLSPTAPHSLPVHPVQLYSMAIMAGVFVLLLRIVRRPHRDGTTFFTFLIAYGALRLGMAPLRQEALRTMKMFSVAFILVGFGGLIVGRINMPSPQSPGPTRPVT